MTNFIILSSARKRLFFILLLLGAGLLTLGAALRYSTPLEGIPQADVCRMDSNWFYENNGSLSPLPQLPCNLEFDSDTLYLVHALPDTTPGPDSVLAIQTRYQSIHVWADQELIYEAAQGREHALSTMYHFIPASAYSGASTLRIGLTRYDSGTDWELFSVMQDHPDAVAMYLLWTHLPTLLVWLCCLLFTLLLAVTILFMAIRKVAGIPLVLALAAFIFLSGTWILLDSKITTLYGGNYALTYFFSYCVFYLLPLPLLCYFQLILELNSRPLRCLTWITAGNACLWMLLHLLGILSIRNTAVSVHLIIVAFLVVFVREFFRKQHILWRKRLFFTVLSMFLIFITALLSIVLYYTGLLPPSNSAVLFVWGLLALIMCMILDTVVMFGRIWKEKQYLEVYRQLATEDSMTGLANRNAYELRLEALVTHPPEEVSIVLFDIDQMKRINDTYGHHGGDEAIRLAAHCIRDVFGPLGDCYRIGGDEFCVILTAPCDIPRHFRQFDAQIRRQNQTGFPVSVSHGWETWRLAAGQALTHSDITALKTAADRKLYLDKNLRAQAAGPSPARQ